MSKNSPRDSVLGERIIPRSAVGNQSDSVIGGFLTMDNFIAGQRVPSERYIHTVHADALLTDAFTWLARKRNLDRGTITMGADDSAIVGRTALATSEDLENAIIAGRRAALDWAARPSSDHREFLRRANRALQENSKYIEELLVAEGHPRKLAQWEIDGILKGTSLSTHDFCNTLNGNPHKIDGSVVALRRRPSGLVGLIPSQNAAAATSLLGLMAVASGNTIIVKPPRSSPLATSWIWQEVIYPQLVSLDAPSGTLSVLCAPPQSTIERWIDNDGVDCLFYVGQSKRGIQIGQSCMERGVRPVLELSGNDSLIVWKDADIEAAANAAAECFYGSAQICMVPKRIAVHPDIADYFLELLVEKAQAIRPGLPSDPDVLLSPVLNPQLFREILEEAVNAGGKLLTGGRSLDHEGREDIAGAFIEPTIVLFQAGQDGFPVLRAIEEETFFPLLPVISWRPEEETVILEEMIHFVNSNKYGLRNSLWTRSSVIAQYWLDRVSNGGILKVNCSHIGFSEILPTHGGTGWSGGPFGEANYPAVTTTRLQAVQINHDYWEGNISRW